MTRRARLPQYADAAGDALVVVGPIGQISVAVDRGKFITDPVVFGEYRRFAFTEDHVSPRVIPGVEGGMHLAPGSEHNDGGVITENAKNRKRMMEKRMGKMETARPDLPKANLFATPGDCSSMWNCPFLSCTTTL